MTKSRLVTVSQAAAILKESRQATTKRLNDGTLPFERIEGEKRPMFVIERAAVEALRDAMLAEREAQLKEEKRLARAGA